MSSVFQKLVEDAQTNENEPVTVVLAGNGRKAKTSDNGYLVTFGNAKLTASGLQADDVEPTGKAYLTLCKRQAPTDAAAKITLTVTEKNDYFEVVASAAIEAGGMFGLIPILEGRNLENCTVFDIQNAENVSIDADKLAALIKGRDQLDAIMKGIL